MKSISIKIKLFLMSLFMTSVTFLVPSVSASATESNGYADRIIFYNMGGYGEIVGSGGTMGTRAISADCIILESNGHYGVIDSGHRLETLDRPAIDDSYGISRIITLGNALSTNMKYRNGSDAAEYMHEKLGINHIDFIIASHSHSDHIGGMPGIADYRFVDSDTGEERGLVDSDTYYYYKPYHHVSMSINDDLDGSDSPSTNNEQGWHNQAFFYQALKAMNNAGATLIDVSGGKRVYASSEGYQFGTMDIKLGDMTIRLYNLYSVIDAEDENINSIVAMISINENLIYTGGDINCELQMEQKIARKIRSDYNGMNVSLMKASHHGASAGSNAKETMDILQPRYIAVTEAGTAISRNSMTTGAFSNAVYFGKYIEKYTEDAFSVAITDIGLVADVTDGSIDFYGLDKNGDSYGSPSDFSLCNRSYPNGWYRWDTQYHPKTGERICDYVYYQNGKPVKDGWIEQNKCRYLIKDYFMQYGWQQVDNKWYYLGESTNDGVPWSGIKMIDGINYGFDTDGALCAGWKKISDNWYYMNQKGIVQTGWLKLNNQWYYLGRDGIMKTGWYQIDNSWYYFDVNGSMKTGWLFDQSHWYYLNTSGVMQTGYKMIDGVPFVFAANGVLSQGKVPITGWQKFNDNWYCFDEEGVFKAGWQHIGKNWYYFNQSGVMQTGWKRSGNNWYYLNISGEMITGWKYVDKVWYYFDSKGIMLTGWKQIGTKWYCFSASGAMQTGWKKSGGKWYYLSQSGQMVTGWQKIDKAWYYMDATGAMQTGWLQIGANWYYFDGSGVMQTGWKKSGGYWYYMNASGVMQTGWIHVDNHDYYMYPDGHMAVSTWIDSYYVNEKGEWVKPQQDDKSKQALQSSQTAQTLQAEQTEETVTEEQEEQPTQAEPIEAE